MIDNIKTFFPRSLYVQDPSTFILSLVCLFRRYKCSLCWPSSTYGDVQKNKVMFFPERTEPVGRKKLRHCLFEDVIPGKAVLVC